MKWAAHALAGTIPRVLAACLVCAAPFTRAAAIGLTISPPAITNDSIGKVTLTITNLTAGKTVNVEWYADLNTNGIIDAGDLLITSFQVTDGQVPLVAGLRNLNVPGDEDGLTNGQIRVVSYYPSVTSSTAIGTSLIRVSDPSGSLTSVTQAFSIREEFYPQGITGRLTSAGTGQPVTNAVVGLQSLVGTSLTFKQSDTHGNYSFYCVPGQYEMLGLNGNGAVYNESPIVSVACGQTTTNNLIITKGTFFIAGRVTDAATGLGIPAMSVDAGTANSLAVLTFADTNGNYALQVTPNTWHVHPSSGAAASTGYVDPSRIGVPVTSASVSNVNFVLTKATALIYGTVSDTSNNPVLGIQLSAGNELGRSVVTNGSYCVGVQAGTWNPAPDSGDLANQGFIVYYTNDLINGSGVTLIDGQALNLNYVMARTNWAALQTPLHLSNSQFQFLLSGLAGQNYTIQSTTNLGANDWLVVLATNLPCGTALILDPHATNSARYYRAVVGP
jgi:hypothetical protein